MRLIPTLLATLVIFTMACASRPKPVSYDAATNPAEVISELQNDMAKGHDLHFDVLAQDDFEEAADQIEDAKEMMAKGKRQDQVLETLGQARAYLNRAQEKSQKLTPELKGILDARNAAFRAGARNFPAEDVQFNKTDESLRSELDDVEKGRMKPERWSNLQARYLALELRAIQSTKLGAANAKVEGARKSGASEYTPKALSQAETDLRAAANVIAANRHNESASAEAVDRANQSAQFLVDVLAETKQGSTRLQESVASNSVLQKYKIGQLDRAVSANAQVINQKETEIQEQRRRLETQNQAMSLDEALKKAREEFKPEEAEVYRDGDRLLIRLKGIQFSTGRSDLPQASLSLLGKVRDVAKELDSRRVMIEGHTDSTGSESTNLTLSQNRAEAVATYFENNGIPKDKVEAVGYGFKKPITTNKTKEGRAINRRVDVILTPMQM